MKTRTRSEEHTSELQSPCNLVCRLLLEKKKNNRRHQAESGHIDSESAYRGSRASGRSRVAASPAFCSFPSLCRFFFLFFFLNKAPPPEISSFSLPGAFRI